MLFHTATTDLEFREMNNKFTESEKATTVLLAEVAKFRQLVLKHLVPLYQKIAKKQAEIMGQKRLSASRRDKVSMPGGPNGFLEGLETSTSI